MKNGCLITNNAYLSRPSWSSVRPILFMQKNYKVQISDNLHYDMLGRWVSGTINSSTKSLMFQVLWNKIILGTSDTWSMSSSSQGPPTSDPAYYIDYWRLSDFNSPCGLVISLADQFFGQLVGQKTDQNHMDVPKKIVLVDVQYCSVFVFYIMVLCLNWQHTCINLVFCILDIRLKTCHYCIHIGFFIANTAAPSEAQNSLTVSSSRCLCYNSGICWFDVPIHDTRDSSAASYKYVTKWCLWT